MADLEGGFLLANFDRCPELVVHDTKLGDLDDLSQLPGVGPGAPLAGPGVFNVGAAVPFQSANIEGVVEDACAPLDLAADGRIAPLPAARAGHALGVEGLGDRSRRPAGDVIPKDPPDDGGLGRVDQTLAGLAVDEVVAVGLAAGNSTGERPAELAALGFGP